MRFPRRRVWAHPDVKSHSLVVLTFEQLCLAPLAGAPKAELVAAAEAGGDLDDLLGPLAVVVDLIAVRRLKLDLLTVMERRIRLRAATAFSLSLPGAHVPRRYLGPLLLQRETWRFERTALPWTGEETDRAQRLEQWRTAHQLPDRVFVRTPEERVGVGARRRCRRTHDGVAKQLPYAC